MQEDASQDTIDHHHPFGEVKAAEENRRIYVTRIVLWVSLGYTLVFASIAYLSEDTGILTFLLSYATALLLSLAILYSTRGYILSAGVATFAICLLFFYLLVSGGVNRTALMWNLSLAPIFVYMWGYRTGTAVACLVGAVAFLLLYTDNSVLQANYDLAAKNRFLPAYGFLVALSAIHDFASFRLQRKFISVSRRLEHIANTDVLTGLKNRRSTQLLLSAGDDTRTIGDNGYAIIIGDIDYFKRVNDSFGHECGDKVLKRVAQCLRDNMRNEDVVARWGGEEFLIILPNTDLVGAKRLADKLCAVVQALEIEYQSHQIKLTMSFGVAASDTVGVDYDSVLRTADKRLYQAKERGRNCVVVT
ncbi:GGDEF domain-containing protein [Exilibacterium tricleocarpae]|uniref:diguanylate cyclase n=1 Tax=Exilibacterium tricleocarpae TaxID=2591008 RepID=A0A545TVK8_9GAMM|nr:GGDEF domain-containing protein [Exilibacterium tricleocarpae]TQV81258.1 GGDEF domain-containing protein [Exilibacterium tricleocarpae]